MADEVLFISKLGGDISGAFGAAKEKIIQNEMAAMTKACMKVEHDAKENCSGRGVGTLRSSITNQVNLEDNSVVGYVGSNLDYAVYVHQGTGIYAKEGNGRKEVPWVYQDAEGNYYSTKGQKPNPFIQDAIDSNRDTILRFFAEVLGGGRA